MVFNFRKLYIFQGSIALSSNIQGTEVAFKRQMRTIEDSRIYTTIDLFDERAIDPWKTIKYQIIIKIMVPFGFEPRENPLSVPVSVPTPSPLPIQVPNPIKVKKSFALILEDLKSEKANAYFSYENLILITIRPTS